MTGKAGNKQSSSAAGEPNASAGGTEGHAVMFEKSVEVVSTLMNGLMKMQTEMIEAQQRLFGMIPRSAKGLNLIQEQQLEIIALLKNCKSSIHSPPETPEPHTGSVTLTEVVWPSKTI